jgi:predicted secreted acid phosphatase
MTSHNNLHGVVFNSLSAEYVALCTQAYYLARYAVLERLNSRMFRNPAIVFDLDETILDNSPYQAWLIKEGRNYDDATWNRWCDHGSATAVPGAVEFVNFVEGLGITPIFITSRVNACRSGTLGNLEKLGLLSRQEVNAESAVTDPDDPERPFRTRLFMKGMSAAKVLSPAGEVSYELRDKFLQRIFCERVRGFEVVLSVGDNLADYAEYYGRTFDEGGVTVPGKHPNSASRLQAVRQDLHLFGRDFILIPNPTYGGWLRALESNGYGASDELARTPNQVREPLDEPTKPFEYDDGQSKEAKAGKLTQIPGIWQG